MIGCAPRLSASSTPLLPYQADLLPLVPAVVGILAGNLAYVRFRQQLESIDHILLFAVFGRELRKSG
jgi:hypothetical protein